MAFITFLFVKVVKINHRELLENYFSLPDYTDFKKNIPQIFLYLSMDF